MLRSARSDIAASAYRWLIAQRSENTRDFGGDWFANPIGHGSPSRIAHRANHRRLLRRVCGTWTRLSREDPVIRAVRGLSVCSGARLPPGRGGRSRRPRWRRSARRRLAGPRIRSRSWQHRGQGRRAGALRRRCACRRRSRASPLRSSSSLTSTTRSTPARIDVERLGRPACGRPCRRRSASSRRATPGGRARATARTPAADADDDADDPRAQAERVARRDRAADARAEPDRHVERRRAPAPRATARARRTRRPARAARSNDGTMCQPRSAAIRSAASSDAWKSCPSSISSTPSARIAAFFPVLLPCGTTIAAGMPWRAAAKPIDCPWLPRVAATTPLHRGAARAQAIEVDEAAAHLEGADRRVVLVLHPDARAQPRVEQRPALLRRRRHGGVDDGRGRLEAR